MRRAATTLRTARVAAILAALAAGPAIAQDFDDEVEDEAAQQQAGVNPHMFVYTLEHFDQWVFGGGRNLQAFRKAADAQLAMRIEQVDRACQLTDAQKARLRLAGLGDLKRILDAYEDKKRFFLATKGDQARINDVLQSIQPLQSAIQAGPFGEESLLAKAIPRALDASQSARFAAVERSRRAYHYRARVELAVHMLDNYVGMTSDQRHRLIRALVEETRVPRRFGRQDYQVVMYLASKVPEAKLRPIFDEAQWRKVRAQMDQVQGLGPFLQANGFLPDDESAKPSPAPAAEPAHVPAPGAVPAADIDVIVD